jgi:hypothetical protein
VCVCVCCTCLSASASSNGLAENHFTGAVSAAPSAAASAGQSAPALAPVGVAVPPTSVQRPLSAPNGSSHEYTAGNVHMGCIAAAAAAAAASNLNCNPAAHPPACRNIGSCAAQCYSRACPEHLCSCSLPWQHRRCSYNTQLSAADEHLLSLPSGVMQPGNAFGVASQSRGTRKLARGRALAECQPQQAARRQCIAHPRIVM